MFASAARQSDCAGAWGTCRAYNCELSRHANPHAHFFVRRALTERAGADAPCPGQATCTELGGEGRAPTTPASTG
eukprot:765030-Pyramimonas_sp.AAC.1